MWWWSFFCCKLFVELGQTWEDETDGPTKECVNGWVSVQDFSLQLEFLGALSTTQFVEQFFEVRSCCIFVSYFSRDVDLQNLICSWVICSLIGPEDSLYSHNQWSQKLKPTIWYSRFSPPQTFSHFFLSYYWLFAKFSFSRIGSCDYFGFGVF